MAVRGGWLAAGLAVASLAALLSVVHHAAAGEFWAFAAPNADDEKAGYDPRIVLTNAAPIDGLARLDTKTATVTIEVPAAGSAFAFMELNPPGSHFGEEGSYRIRTKDNLAATQFNGAKTAWEEGHRLATDATRLLSTTEMGDDYYVVSMALEEPAVGRDIGGFEPRRMAPNYIAIVATTNGTRVSVTPTATIAAGPGVSTMLPGREYLFDLDEFQVLQLEASALTAGSGDLVGSHVKANKPFALFAGSDHGASGSSGSDIVFEEVLPTRLAGREFVVCSPYGEDLVRVVSIVNLTSVTIDGGETRLLTRAGDHVDFSGRGDLHITSDQPILVMQLLDEPDTGRKDRDPAMVMLMPVTEWSMSYHFWAPPDWDNRGVIAHKGTTAFSAKINGTDFTFGATSGTSRAVPGGYMCDTGLLEKGNGAKTLHVSTDYAFGLSYFGTMPSDLAGLGGDASYWLTPGRPDNGCIDEGKAPPAPKDVRVGKYGADPVDVRVRWNIPDDGLCGLIGVNVYRLEMGEGPYELRGMAVAPETTYDDEIPRACLSWLYKLRAVNAYGEGPESEEVRYDFPLSKCDETSTKEMPINRSGLIGSQSEDPGGSDAPGDGTDDKVANLDSDGDGVVDGLDVCAFIPDPDQADLDRDQLGDVCDTDVDGDGVEDLGDNCVRDRNPDQDDTELDGIGDACDLDDDDDLVLDAKDNCPLDANQDQADADGDEVGDACQWFARGGTPELRPNRPSAARSDVRAAKFDQADKGVPSWAFWALGGAGLLTVLLLVFAIRRRRLDGPDPE